MVTTTQLRLALEAEDERSANNRMELDWISFGLRLEFSKNLRNVLARPVMGTIFLVIGRAKRTPHWGVQSRFRVIYICIYVCRYVSYVKLTA